jgi:hypothetical protein
MNPLYISIGVFACVFGGAVLGMYVSPLLPVHQQSSESRDIVRLGMGLVAVGSEIEQFVFQICRRPTNR